MDLPNVVAADSLPLDYKTLYKNNELILDQKVRAASEVSSLLEMVNGFICPSYYVCGHEGVSGRVLRNEGVKRSSVVYPAIIDDNHDDDDNNNNNNNNINSNIIEKGRRWNILKWDGIIRIAYLGRLSGERQPGLFLHTAKLLLLQNNNNNNDSKSKYMFYIAGSGTLKEALKLIIEEFNMDKYVIFVGELSKPEVTNFLKNIDIVINPRMVSLLNRNNFVVLDSIFVFILRFS